jgi:hypothetical protein
MIWYAQLIKLVKTKTNSLTEALDSIQSSIPSEQLSEEQVKIFTQIQIISIEEFILLRNFIKNNNIGISPYTYIGIPTSLEWFLYNINISRGRLGSLKKAIEFLKEKIEKEKVRKENNLQSRVTPTREITYLPSLFKEHFKEKKHPPSHFETYILE